MFTNKYYLIFDNRDRKRGGLIILSNRFYRASINGFCDFKIRNCPQFLQYVFPLD